MVQPAQLSQTGDDAAQAAVKIGRQAKNQAATSERAQHESGPWLDAPGAWRREMLVKKSETAFRVAHIVEHLGHDGTPAGPFARLTRAITCRPILCFLTGESDAKASDHHLG